MLTLSGFDTNTRSQGRLIVLGLNNADLNRLTAGKPLIVTFADLGVPTHSLVIAQGGDYESAGRLCSRFAMESLKVKGTRSLLMGLLPDMVDDIYQGKPLSSRPKNAPIQKISVLYTPDGIGQLVKALKPRKQKKSKQSPRFASDALTRIGPDGEVEYGVSEYRRTMMQRQAARV